MALPIPRIQNFADAQRYFDSEHARLTTEIANRLEIADAALKIEDVATAREMLAAVSELKTAKDRIEAAWILPANNS